MYFHAIHFYRLFRFPIENPSYELKIRLRSVDKRLRETSERKFE